MHRRASLVPASSHPGQLIVSPMEHTLAPEFASPPAFRVQDPEQPVYPVSSYPHFAHAPVDASQDMGGTWWYVPTQKHAPLTPSPPADRSEWVMWVGNVSSNVVNDELWQFFAQLADGAGGSTTDESAAPRGGVLSIFLISSERCAFVSYETEAHLEAAILRFDGVPVDIYTTPVRDISQI
ncbi:hypothetical protein C8R44DRAFT_163682 [Mycena epipterygia]|nr:hypothetical protein C8R44DRAFT_163682 [Mycena epipterygia]